MRKAALLFAALGLCVLSATAQRSGGAYVEARSNMVAYDDEAGIMKSAYRESPYFMELTGRWNQKQTDSSIVYSRELDVEKYWRDYRVFLNVRCGKACRVLLNGKDVGYSADSRHWGEFELNRFLKYGKKNTLAIEAMKHPYEAMLERDDLAVGLNGEPYLLFKGDPNVADMTLTADYDAVTSTGTLTVDASVFCSKKKGKYYLEVEVWDTKGHTLDRMGRWVVFDKKSEAKVDMTRSWNGVEPWSAETPNLYTAVLRLRNVDMEEEETVGARFGFRSVEVKDGLLTLNGKPLTIKGVTYGLEHTEGLASRERIRQDLKSMKQNNINAVRTAKYSPMEPYFYQLCDELGLYVVCDANLMPASSQHQAIATDKDYIPLFERRVDNLYGRYKNHPSIVAWSLGECRDNGICMGAAYKRLKTLEKSRPVVFSGADHSENTDIIAPLYPTEKVLRQSLEKSGERPYLMLASVKEDDFTAQEGQWTLVESRRTLQGGFVDAWPLPAPMLSDLRHLYSPFDVHLTKMSIDDAEFAVYNRNDFVDFSRYILEYTIYTNLRPNISAGDLPVAIRGGGVETVKLRIPPVDLQAGEELFIRFDLMERRGAAGNYSGRNCGTVVFPLPQKKASCSLFVNNGPAIDSIPPMQKAKLYFVGHDDWRIDTVGYAVRRPDEHTVCKDYMLRYSTSAGTEVCDVRVTHSRFSTGDEVVDYTLAPIDRLRGTLQPALKVVSAFDSVMWYGLDKEVRFKKRHGGLVGTYTAAANPMRRQQVRWCSVQQGVQMLFMNVVGELCTMEVRGQEICLTPTVKDSYRLHLYPYTEGKPTDFYDVELPDMAAGILKPPVITASEAHFSAPLTVTLSSPVKGNIHYTLDGSEPSETSPLYAKPFVLTTTTVVKARVYGKEGAPSFTSTRKFNYDYIVKTTFSQKPNTPFNVGTDTLLFDGEKGMVDNHTQGWLGFSGMGVETTVELSKPIDIEYITLRYAHAPEMWAFAPKAIKVYLSADGETYTDTLNVALPFDPASVEENNPQVVEIRVPVGKNGIGYLKVDAQSIGTVPSWHRAKGLKPWLLMDEIEVGEATKLTNAKDL